MSGWRSGKPRGPRPARAYVANAVADALRRGAELPTTRSIVAATRVSRQRAHVLLCEEYKRITRRPLSTRKA